MDPENGANIPNQNNNLNESISRLAENQEITNSLLAANLQQSQSKERGNKDELIKKELCEIFGKDNYEEIDQKQISHGLEYKRFWDDFGPKYFTEQDKDKIAAIFIPEKFIEFSKVKLQELLQKKYPEKILEDLNDKEKRLLMIQSSNAIKDEIVLSFGNLIRKLDEKMPGEFFDEIVKQDMWHGIEMANLKLTTALENTKKFFEIHSEEYKDISLSFYKEKTEVLSELKKEEKDGEIHVKPTARLNPNSKKEKTGVSEFVHYIGIYCDNEFSSRRYLHNVRASFLKGPGEHGHYGGLAAYSKQLSTVDLDEMLSLPDSDLVMMALQYYDKINSAELAKYDWKLNPNIYARQKADIMTKNEEHLFKSIKLMYCKKYGLDINQENNEYDWRIRRAHDMALGFSRGIFLSEVEKAASADPILNPDGSPKFLGVYTSGDPAPLMPFNMLHLYLRFQSEGLIKGPLLFTPVEGLSFKNWNHNKLFDYMTNFFNSFIKGKKEFPYKDGKKIKIFLEKMVNMANIGGIVTRTGWRFESAYEGLLVDNDPKKANLPTHTENLKRIDNIGYEITSHYFNNMISEDNWKKLNLDSIQEEEKNSQSEKKDFINFLYKRYINPDFDFQNLHPSSKEYQEKLDKGIEEMFNTLRQDVETNNPDEYKKANNEGKNALIGLALKNRCLISIVKNRFPTFFIKMYKDRDCEDGERPWEKLRKEAGFEDLDSFDKIIKNIGLAETLLKTEVADEMQGLLLEEESLSGVKAKNYLNSETLSNLLGKTLSKEEFNEILTKIENSNEIEKLLSISEAKPLSNIEAKNYLNSETLYNLLGKTLSKEEFNEILTKTEISEMDRVLLLKEKYLSNIEAKNYLNSETLSNLLGKTLSKEEFNEILTKIENSNEMQRFFSEFNKTLKVFDLINKNYLTEDKTREYIKKFLIDKDYKFALGTEELDPRFLAFRAGGGNTIARFMGENALIEKDFNDGFGELINSLHKIAIDPKHDISPIITALTKMKAPIESLHGPDNAQKMVYELARVVVSYYKKDEVAKGFFGILGINRKNSLAAEFAGKSTGVWEWDAYDIDKFWLALEHSRLIPREPYQLGNKAPEYEDIKFKIPFTNKEFKIPLLKKRKETLMHCSKKGRAETGGSPKDILIDSIGKYIPIAVLLLFFAWIKKAFSDEFEQKR